VGSLEAPAPLDVVSLMEGNWAWRRELFLSLEFDPALNFDDASMYGLDLCFQARQRGYRILYDARALVYHHAAPRVAELDRSDRLRRDYSYSRNYTFILMRRLPAWRRVVFSLWWFLIGDRASPGLGAAAAELLRGSRGWGARFVSAWAGKIEGMRLSLEGRKTPAPENCLNMAERYRLLIVASHPVQYAAPVYRELAAHPRIDLLVAYCSLQGAGEGLDPEFGVRVAWDVPLLEGYRWVQVPNRSPVPRSNGFFRLMNPGLWSLVRHGGFDAMVLFTGYVCASFWIALAAAKLSRTKVLFGTDAHELRPRSGRMWKAWVKRAVWPGLFRLADEVIVPSSGSVQLMRQLGIPAGRITLTPYVVNNPWWREQAGRADREAVRRSWQVPTTAPVVLFCGKLQPWKRPMDLLQAFARAERPDAFLVFAGEGPLRAQLAAEAARLGLESRVRFLGFANQSELPGIYGAADLLVLPSEYEPFGLVVNEAMLCGCPVAVSDRVGARLDLIREGETGRVIPVGDVPALAAALRELLAEPSRLRTMGEAGRKRMETWSPAENIRGLLSAIERAVGARAGGRHQDAMKLGA
jgi:glycosyltransferase involved in cell wall biosynthesis